MIHRTQTRKEEVANSITHFLGVIFCVLATPFALYRAYGLQNFSAFWAVGIFALTMLLVYGASTSYHFAKEPRIKNLLNKLDHISIYFFIAGTHTPIIIQFIDTKMATIFLSVMWGTVLVGMIHKLFFLHKWATLSIILYLIQGWMIIFVVQPLLQNMPLSIFYWLLVGSLSYTIGVYFFVKDNKMYYHTIWHLFVLGGSILHFIAIYQGLST